MSGPVRKPAPAAADATNVVAGKQRLKARQAAQADSTALEHQADSLINDPNRPSNKEPGRYLDMALLDNMHSQSEVNDLLARLRPKKKSFDRQVSDIWKEGLFEKQK